MATKKEYIRKKVARRLEKIARKERLEVSEVYKVFRAQFLFAKEKIEGLDKEWLASTTEEELEKLVFNFIYIGKIHSNKRMQNSANKKKSKLNKGEKDGKDQD